MIMMTEACRQDQDLILDDASEKARRIGAVFADFEFTYTSNQNIDDSIQRTFESIKANIKRDRYSTIAWSFPRAIRTHGDPNPNPVIVLPGAMLLAKFVGYKTHIKQ